jgi:hypothetical protein
MRSAVSDIEVIYVLLQEQSRDGMRGRRAYLTNLVRRTISSLSSFKSPVRVLVPTVQPQCHPQTLTHYHITTIKSMIQVS